MEKRMQFAPGEYPDSEESASHQLPTQEWRVPMHFPQSLLSEEAMRDLENTTELAIEYVASAVGDVTFDAEEIATTAHAIEHLISALCMAKRWSMQPKGATL